MFPALLVQRSHLIQIGLLDENCPSYQEWDTAIRLAKIAEFVHVQTPLFEWRRHAGETISKSGARDLAGYRYVIEKHRMSICHARGELGWRMAHARSIVHAFKLGLFEDAARLAQTGLQWPVAQWVCAWSRRKRQPPLLYSTLKIAAKLGR